MIFRIFSFLFERISTNAFFKLKDGFGVGSDENFGTILNIKNAQMIPKIQSIGILFKPKYWAKAEDNNGPVENPKVPNAMKIPIFFAEFEVVNFETNPKACG